MIYTAHPIFFGW